MEKSCNDCIHNTICKIWSHIKIIIKTEDFTLFKEDITKDISNTIGKNCYHYKEMK